MKQLLVRPEGPYGGKLLTDGLEHYDDICQELQLLHFGCWQYLWAHFFKACKVSQLPSSRTLASKSIDYYIRPEFAVETGIDALRSKYEQRGEVLSLPAIHAIRQSKPTGSSPSGT